MESLCLYAPPPMEICHSADELRHRIHRSLGAVLVGASGFDSSELIAQLDAYLLALVSEGHRPCAFRISGAYRAAECFVAPAETAQQEAIGMLLSVGNWLMRHTATVLASHRARLAAIALGERVRVMKHLYDLCKLTAEVLARVASLPKCWDGNAATGRRRLPYLGTQAGARTLAIVCRAHAQDITLWKSVMDSPRANAFVLAQLAHDTAISCAASRPRARHPHIHTHRLAHMHTGREDGRAVCLRVCVPVRACVRA
jgi:hypothetical protein